MSGPAPKTWKSWQADSKRDWGSTTAEGECPGTDRLLVGTLQRIASSLERMEGMLFQLTPAGEEAAQKKAAAERLHQQYQRWAQLRAQIAWRLYLRVDSIRSIPGRLQRGMETATRQLTQTQKLFELDGSPSSEDRKALESWADSLDLAAVEWERLAPTKTLAWLREVFPKKEAQS
jgi:hypothetical protein